ncbi:hypothetical protein VspSTUT11_04100 [Vibrio sp. STUT-A11]|nr:hypothetical protein VspSTUT11_04100 [Vibrio sp. STUT-A11]
MLGRAWKSNDIDKLLLIIYMAVGSLNNFFNKAQKYSYVIWGLRPRHTKKEEWLKSPE